MKAMSPLPFRKRGFGSLAIANLVPQVTEREGKTYFSLCGEKYSHITTQSPSKFSPTAENLTYIARNVRLSMSPRLLDSKSGNSVDSCGETNRARQTILQHNRRGTRN